jgi:DNA-binding transcriptional regulator GbsR (MarR family)
MEETTTELVERFGLQFEQDGLPRIAGRMLGLLMVSAEPRTLEDLAEELKASRTSANTNARLLERMGAVERTTRPGDRRDYYRIVENFHVRMLEARLEQMRGLRDLFSDAVTCCEAEATKGEGARVHDRLCNFAKFHDDVVAMLESMRQRWFDEQNDRPVRRKTG